MSGIHTRGGRFKGDIFNWDTSISFLTGLTDQRFAPVGGQTVIATETDADATNDLPFIVRRMRVIVTANTYDAALVIAFRRNGATPSGASVSITALTIGEFVTGPLSHALSLNDLFNFSYDATGAGAAKTVDGVIYLFCQRVIE